MVHLDFIREGGGRRERGDAGRDAVGGGRGTRAGGGGVAGTYSRIFRPAAYQIAKHRLRTNVVEITRRHFYFF